MTGKYLRGTRLIHFVSQEVRKMYPGHPPAPSSVPVPGFPVSVLLHAAGFAPKTNFFTRSCPRFPDFKEESLRSKKTTRP